MAAPLTAFGFDYGERRIGLAVGQSVSRTASPLATLPARHGQPDWDALGRLVREWQPEAFVVGLPTTADGAPHALKPAIERFGRRLGGRYGRPVHYVDERLSSHAAEAAGRGSRLGLDAHAAQQILETWLVEYAPRAE